MNEEDREAIIEGITARLLEEAPGKMREALQDAAGKGSLKLAFSLMRYGFVAWIAYYWDTLSKIFRPRG